MKIGHLVLTAVSAVGLLAAADPEGDVPPIAADVRWLEPYPDRLVDPHEAAVARETLEIGFVERSSTATKGKALTLAVGLRARSRPARSRVLLAR